MKDARISNNRILVVDDNPAIHEDIRKILSRQSADRASLEDDMAVLFNEKSDTPEQGEFEIDSAFQGQEGLAKVEHACAAGKPYAVAFVDVRMPPGWDGVETINRIWQNHPDLQIVICTAYSDYSWAEMIRRIGTSDSLVILKKPFDNIEVLQLAHALTEKWILNQEVKYRLHDLDQLVNQRTTELQSTNDRLKTANDQLKKEMQERIQTERLLLLSEERFSKAFMASPIPLAIRSLAHEKFVDANDGFLQITELTREELVGRTPTDLKLWEDADTEQRILEILRAEMSVRHLSCRLRARSRSVKDILLSVEFFELNGEAFLLIIAQDLTEQIQLEKKFRQSQKMEAVGQLAAGVAHDFNNILTVIQGNAGLLLETKPAESSDRRPLEVISASVDRASRLVRQLLTFSRKQVVQAKPMKISGTLSVVSEMLLRVLGEHIAVKVTVATDLPAINADAGMMEQMVMNLAVNARDAMPDGGELTIAAETTEVTSEAASGIPDAHPGQFVCLTVADTGCGMAPEILSHIFEPFFTTKPAGKGTGLGLATAYGIAKQHNGWVDVQSQLGKGTIFRIFIPICTQDSEAPLTPQSSEVLKGGTETILVAEDEELVRNFVTEVLRSKGYKVLSAGSGISALQEWANHRKDIDLLLTDMVMPGGLTGRELAVRLLAEEPSLKVIYTSGYSPGLAGKDLGLIEGRNFLAKPYPPSQLLQMVRECLDSQSQPAATAEMVLT